MHTVTVFLDRVFDVQPDYFSGNLSRTRFSFEGGGRQHLSVVVDGQPQLEAGQTITAILAQPDDWQTLMGLRVHETGQVCMPGMTNHIMLLVTMTVLGACLPPQLSTGGRSWLMPLLGVSYVILAGLLMRGAWSVHRLRRALSAADRSSSS